MKQAKCYQCKWFIDDGCYKTNCDNLPTFPLVDGCKHFEQEVNTMYVGDMNEGEQFDLNGATYEVESKESGNVEAVDISTGTSYLFSEEEEIGSEIHSSEEKLMHLKIGDSFIYLGKIYTVETIMDEYSNIRVTRDNKSIVLRGDIEVTYISE